LSQINVSVFAFE